MVKLKGPDEICLFDVGAHRGVDFDVVVVWLLLILNPAIADEGTVLIKLKNNNTLLLILLKMFCKNNL